MQAAHIVQIVLQLCNTYLLILQRPDNMLRRLNATQERRCVHEHLAACPAAAAAACTVAVLLMSLQLMVVVCIVQQLVYELSCCKGLLHSVGAERYSVVGDL
jgi:hypothetical protein